MSLLVRGLWWRRGLNAGVFAVAVVTIAAAALGPLYARAGAESTLNDHLTGAGAATGLHISADVDVSRPGAVAKVTATLPKPGSVRGYPRSINGIYTPAPVSVALTGTGLGGVKSHLLWRQEVCQHLVIVHGRCPARANEVLVSQRTLDSGAYDWHLGTALFLFPIRVEGFPWAPNASPTALHVVGTYRPRDTADPFWFGQNYFDAHATAHEGDTVDTIMVTESTFAALPQPSYAEVDVDYPLDSASLRLANVRSERAALAGIVRRYGPPATTQPTTGLPAVLDSARREQRLVDTGTLLVTVQLGLLAWLVLFQLVADAIDARGDEIAMAKLRGLSTARTVRFGLAQPIVLLALAVPVGLLAAWLVTHVLAGTVLAPGTPVVFAAAPLVAGLVAFAGGLMAALLAGYRTFARSVLEQWRRTTRRPAHGRLGLAVDVVVAVAAGTGLLILRGQHRGSGGHGSAALLAPGLLVLGTALLGVRLLPVACRWIAGRTRASPRLGLFLASRQVARRTVGLRLAALLAVAVGLATFAVAGESVAGANRGARARSELGAAQVALIQYDSTRDPVDAARRADPQGRWAMAVARWLPDGGDSVTGTVIGVDSARLTSVAYPAAGGSPLLSLRRDVGASTVPVITLRAARLRIHITASNLSADRPVVQLNLRTARQPFLDVELQPMQPGAHTYPAVLPCGQGCQLRGITWDRPITVAGPITGTALVTGIDTGDGSNWTPLDASLTHADAWRAATPQGQATDEVHATQGGVQDTFGSDNGGYGGIVYADAPSPIPAVVTPSGIAAGVTQPKILDGFDTVAAITVVSTVDLLPGVLDNGVMMDVTSLQAELPAFSDEASWEIWIGPHAPRDAVARLTAAGLQVQSVHSESGRVRLLARQGPALALLLLLVCAVAGAVLAVGGTAISISASARRRSYEIAALRAVGLGRAALWRASLIEQLLLLGTAVLLGVPAGFLAARLTMPVIPEFSDSTPIALHYLPKLAPTAVFTGAFIVLLTVTALLAALWLIRIAVPSRLRETEA
ncbi:MAG: ABC transporter permease [Jatrophihabitans sp.]